MPELRPGGHRVRDSLVHVAQRRFVHFCGKIARPRQRFRAGQRDDFIGGDVYDTRSERGQTEQETGNFMVLREVAR